MEPQELGGNRRCVLEQGGVGQVASKTVLGGLYVTHHLGNDALTDAVKICLREEGEREGPVMIS